MEILAHALWAGGLAQLANRHIRVKHKTFRLKPLGVAGWAVFPDVIAFLPSWMWFSWQFLNGELGLGQLPQHGYFNMNEPVAAGGGEIGPLWLVRQIYHFSHSIVVFALAVLLAIFLYKLITRKKAFLSAGLWSLAGWLSHILVDVPSHSYEFSSTPIFWPFSDWRFGAGLDWGSSTFMFYNYALLFLFYLFLWYTEPNLSPKNLKKK